MSSIFYFGCWGGTGHFLRDPSGRMADAAGPWQERELDALFCPGGPKNNDTRRQIEGVARLVHVQGWTALAFWDRSSDRRGGSNSAILAAGTLDFEAMVAIAADNFPSVWARITTAFEVRLGP